MTEPSTDETGRKRKQVPEVLVTKHVLLGHRQIETWVRILRVLRHMGWISWATNFTRRDELGADEDARFRASDHMEAKQSRMRDAYPDRAALAHMQYATRTPYLRYLR